MRIYTGGGGGGGGLRGRAWLNTLTMTGGYLYISIYIYCIYFLIFFDSGCQCHRACQFQHPLVRRELQGTQMPL